MRKLTVKVINSTQESRIGVNETLAVVKQQREEHEVGPSREPRRKPRSSQPAKWFIEFATRQEQFNQAQLAFNQEVRNFMIEQKQFNQAQLAFNQQVREFMVYVVKRLDNLERRLDNIVKLNNLKEAN